MKKKYLIYNQYNKKMKMNKINQKYTKVKNSNNNKKQKKKITNNKKKKPTKITKNLNIQGKRKKIITKNMIGWIVRMKKKRVRRMHLFFFYSQNIPRLLINYIILMFF